MLLPTALAAVESAERELSDLRRGVEAMAYDMVRGWPGDPIIGGLRSRLAALLTPTQEGN